jgi:long-chain fatty acid transport protein
MKRTGFVPLLAALLLLAVPAAWAGNGHTLHGVGAVNSSMGGAGVALPIDTLGGLLLNPALASGMEGSHFSFSAEYNTAKNKVASTVQTPVGPFSGSTKEGGDTSLIPAFGFVHHDRGSSFAYGIGFLGLAGFGADYPQDPTNPILAPQPNGFGRVYSNYQLLKVPTVLSWQISDDFSFGVALNVARASLTADPAGFAAPDCSGPQGPCFVPRVNADSAWGTGLGVGMRYKFGPAWSLGASYNTKTKFEDFEWNSAVANPQLATFGRARKIKLRLDMPAIAIVGLGWTPSDRLAVALDGKWINYEKAAGFEDILGFKDIKVYEIGVQYRLSDRLALRGGYNKNQNPIPDNRAFFTVETPAVFETHYTGGIGFRVSDILSLDAAYYHVPENSITGPIFSPAGPVPGATVTTRMAMDSLVVTFNFGLQQ